jgi:hypothetical protein
VYFWRTAANPSQETVAASLFESYGSTEQFGRVKAAALPAEEQRTVEAPGVAVPLLLETEATAVAAADAREVLRSLRAVRPANITQAHQLLAERLAALRRLLANDNDVRREWNRRLDEAAPRGIVVPAGGPKALANAFVTLHVLQHTLRCTLPVVIMHWGASEVANGTAAFFRQHLPAVRFLDIQAAGGYPGHHVPPYDEPTPKQDTGVGSAPASGYPVKAASLYLAPFREVTRFLDHHTHRTCGRA